MRVLVVEDDPVNQKVTAGLLARLGIAVDTADDGESALVRLVQQRYDVVLMDINMPQLDGLSAVARMRDELPAVDQPWVVAMTANALEGDRERFLAGGMDAYLPKPVRLAELAAVFDAVPVSLG
jgi:CheY-like chemotaxis protein